MTTPEETAFRAQVALIDSKIETAQSLKTNAIAAATNANLTTERFQMEISRPYDMEVSKLSRERIDASVAFANTFLDK